ncbi:MAG: oxidoreductase, partial [Mycobacterium sp.]
GDAGARRLSRQLDIPVYDVQKVGYPQRMRDYDARRRIERDRAMRRDLEG